MRTSFFFVLFSIYRFSSGDLTQDIDDGASDPGTSVGRPQPAPLQQQPMPGGPPNVPPPNPPGMMKFNLTRKSWFSLISLSLSDGGLEYRCQQVINDNLTSHNNIQQVSLVLSCDRKLI